MRGTSTVRATPNERGRPYGWLRRRALPVLLLLCAAVVLFRRGGRQVVQVTARSSHSVPVRCHTATRVLVAHEQHLQAVGSDARLLLLLQQLRQLGASVSLLVRAANEAARRHPPTHEIAELLGAANLSAVPLGRGGVPVARAPAVYEMGGGRAFQQLLRHEQFDLVLVGLWFWYDPQPSFAEMLVPLVAGVARRAGAEAQAGAGGATGGGRAFQQLLRHEQFDLVLVGLWFWYDPQPSFAEMLVPLVAGVARRAGAEAQAGAGGATGGGPLLALLCDDAHSERAARLQHEVPDPRAHAAAITPTLTLTQP